MKTCESTYEYVRRLAGTSHNGRTGISKRYSKSFREEVLSLFNDGKINPADISRACRVSYGTAMAWTNPKGKYEPKRGYTKRVSNERIGAMASLYAERDQLVKEGERVKTKLAKLQAVIYSYNQYVKETEK